MTIILARLLYSVQFNISSVASTPKYGRICPFGFNYPALSDIILVDR